MGANAVGMSLPPPWRPLRVEIAALKSVDIFMLGYNSARGLISWDIAIYSYVTRNKNFNLYSATRNI